MEALPFILVGAGGLMDAEAEDQFGKDTAANYARAAKARMVEGNRESHEIRRQGRVMQSDAAAAIAGGGGVTDDVAGINVMSDIEQVADYNALNALYEAKSEGRELMHRGHSAQKLGRKRALATLVNTGGKLYGMKK